MHLKNALENIALYDYRKINTLGEKTNTPNVSITSALADEEWDYISFQQVSSSSGIFESFVETLTQLYQFVNENVTNENVKYILHQTWAYSEDSTHPLYGNYNHDQMTMYHAIVDAIERAKNLIPIDKVIPVGTAIQNGRTNSVGDNFCRDGYHLKHEIGRYTAACTWYEMLFDKRVINNPYRPENLTESEVNSAWKAAHNAVLSPNKITTMSND